MAGEVSGIFALTPAESKRLIAKAVAQLPVVKNALANGRVIVANGTTTAFVAEEIVGRELPRFNYTAGVICDGMLAVTDKDERLLPIVLDRGQEVQIGIRDAVMELKADDVFIKSANAVDVDGNVGILMADDKGGTIGTSIGVLSARGVNLVCPVGLEKLVPCVLNAATKCGIGRFKYTLGLPVGLMPVTTAQTITEIQALEMLTGVDATHVSSGGVAGSEGSVVLVVEGNEEQVAATFELVRGIKGRTKNVAKTGAISWPELGA